MSDPFKKFIFYCSWVLVLQGCTQSGFFRKIQVNQFPENRLMFDIRFSTKETAQCFIEYQEPESQQKFYSTLSSSHTRHSLRLINLKPLTQYSFTIKARSGNQVFISDTLKFQTDSLPPGLPSIKVIKSDYFFPGYILLKKFFNPGALYIINNQGDITWYYPYDTAILRAFDFTPERHILSLVDSTVFEETDLYQNFFSRTDLKEKGINQFMHHELFESAEGNRLALLYFKKVFDLSSVGGITNDTIRSDGIIMLDKDGNKVWSWNIFDHADPLVDPDILRLQNDWGHANSLSYDRDGHLLISYRDFNQVWKIHYPSGEIIWKLGFNGNRSISGTEPFLMQHHVHVNLAGHLMMFDNGNSDRGFSRVLSLRADSSSGAWIPEVNIRLDEESTTFRMGSAMMMDQEHILVCSPKKLLTLSVMDTSGLVVWKASADFDSYRAIYLPPDILENKEWF